ncbi:unnamed protein product [Prorocentrum cordatum]|uniref:AMP-dependent synthetase/ligase domain-containing protein n=1 Tax=Prorocentrum cordatum TaxID=2364126 RepID=A0ABN9U8M8_9DINO|nr:unnamed protein product [Polarella glacialis]
MRCGVPFVWMGAGELPARSRRVEAARNQDILARLSPVAVLLDDAGVPEEVVPEWTAAASPPRLLRLPAGLSPTLVGVVPSASLCYMLTGGTTGGSKCVEVSHTMALHEVRAYPRVAKALTSDDRVLQHTPVLWAASAMGQIDIALAFGAATCISSSADADAITSCSATVLGIVPSALEAIEPTAVPSVKHIFTWGEPLSRVLAMRWRSSHTKVFELLISTEYWLSFVSEGQESPTGRTLYHVVPGVDVAVLPPGGDGQGSSVPDGEQREAASAEACMVFAQDAGGPFFRTRDLVHVLDDGFGALLLEFCGRTDSLVKVAGQFVDLAAAEGRLTAALNAEPAGLAVEASIVPATAGTELAAGPAGVVAALGRARAELPRGAALHLVRDPLPRDPVTGKIDRKALLKDLMPARPSNPAWPALSARLCYFPRWWLALAAAGCLDIPSLLRLAFGTGGRGSRSPLRKGSLLFHIASVPYLWLLSQHLPKTVVRRITYYIPFGRVGFLCLVYHVTRISRGARRQFNFQAVAKSVLLVGSVAGMALARARGRLLPWWTVFWAAIPDHLEAECGWWLQAKSWAWYVKALLAGALDAPGLCLRLSDWFLELLIAAPPQCRRLCLACLSPGSPPEVPAALRGEWAQQGAAGACAAQPSGAGAAADARQASQRVQVVQAEPEAQSSNSADAAGGPVALDGLGQEAQREAGLGAGAHGPAGGVAAEGRTGGAVVGASAGLAWACRECGASLAGERQDWRSEDGESFCRQCWKAYDNRWWDEHTRDVVDVWPPLGTEGGRPARSMAEAGDTASAALQPGTAAGARLLQLLGPLLRCSDRGVRGDSTLAGVDSLAVLTLCRDLRLAAPGLVLRPQDVLQCSSATELLALVDARALEVWFAPGQYTSTCKWLYGCKGLLDERIFRVAAARLIARHEVLHSKAKDGQELCMELVRFLKESATLRLALWPEVEAAVARCPAWARRPAAALARTVEGAWSWALKETWPRSVQVPITQEFLDERVVVVRCSSFRDVEEQASRLRDEFRPPFVMALFLLPPGLGAAGPRTGAACRAEESHTWGAPSSFVYFVVSHAYSDGFCSLPLINDFSCLYAGAEQAARPRGGRRGTGQAAATAALVPLPPVARFAAALDGRPQWSHPEQLSLRATCFDGPWEPAKPPWVYVHEVLLEAGAVETLRHCARSYSIPFDVILFSALLASMFRADEVWERSWSQQARGGAGSAPLEASLVRSVALTLYAPMRDGDLSDAMVGLFSDWRDCEVPCGPSATLLGFCMQVADMIRNRRWTVFDPIQNSQRIPSAQKRARGEGGHPSAWPEESADAWWLVMDINGDSYPPGWCRGLVGQLPRAIEELAQRPLLPVLGDGARPTGGAGGTLPAMPAAWPASGLAGSGAPAADLAAVLPAPSRPPPGALDAQ